MKIPSHARLAFKGKLFEVWQWDQELFDGSTTVFESIRRTDTIIVLPIVGDKIVITDQEQPIHGKFHTFIGGRMEEGEDPLAAAKRETLEESGLASDDWELIKSYSPRSYLDWSIHFYVARDCKKIQEPNLEPGEKIVLKEVTWEEFIKLLGDEDFWGSDIAQMFLGLVQDPARLEQFRQRIFKK
jgi:ADP-ribose pyrophosphatase